MFQKMFLLTFTLFISFQAFAGFRVYQHSQKDPQQIDTNHFISSQGVNRNGQINWGLINTRFLEFFHTVVNSPISGKANTELLLKAHHRDNVGFTLRYKQRYKRTNIEGAELIASFNSRGQLLSINSSLVALENFNVIPTISAQNAYRAVINQLRYQNPELGRSANDGLMIAIYKKNRNPLLLWQFSLREKRSHKKSAIVQVVANGNYAGKIYKVRNAHHKFSDISVYDATEKDGELSDSNLGVQVIRNGLSMGVPIPQAASEVYANFKKVTSFYEETFGHVGYDKNKAPVTVSVNITDEDIAENAAWVGPWKTFIFGIGGDYLYNFTRALDVVGHEFTHAVISESSDLIYEGQSGALNEHLADVFGEMIEVAHNDTLRPFALGERVVRGEKKPLRNMLQPQLGLSPQPAHVGQIPAEYNDTCLPNPFNDNCGVHSLSGIPNRFSALVAYYLGWPKVSNVFYRVMTQRLTSESNFTDYRNQMIEECYLQLSETDCNLFKSAFDNVGII